MIKSTLLKRLTLAGLLLVLLLGISGCFSKPDRIEELPTQNPDIVPFPTVTPTPTPMPTTDASPEESGLPGLSIITAPPIPTSSSIAVVTATPTPTSQTTSQPTATPTPQPTDDGTLRNGSTGSAVKSVQQKLKDLGYYTGSVDGTFGSGTESAVKEFQKANGLTADGIVGSRTLSTLNSSSAKAKATPNTAYATSRPRPVSYTPATLGTYRYLQMGSSGSDVTRLQNRLKDLGYFKGTVNGTFGADTEAAVIAFQERNGLWADGVAGENTQSELFSSAALAAPSGSSSVPSTGYRTLANGAFGDDVSMLQLRLQELGYYTGTVDGQFGQSTVTAVKLFQQTNGLTVDGEAGSTTQARIYSNNVIYAPTTAAVPSAAPSATQALKPGDMGEAVYSLQERLYDLGYYYGQIDGIYSEAVALAVRAFQAANKLTVDGNAGRNTLAALYGQNAVASGETQTVEHDSYTTLKQGDSGERVRALQGLLSTYGYFVDVVDGVYGLSTTVAVQQLQIRNGLTSDGIAGPATLQLLYQGNPISALTEAVEKTTAIFETLRSGMSGPDVVMLQEFLQDLGYLVGELSGEFDATTFLAVQEFQQRNNLPADGVAGQETLSLLYSGNGLPSESYTIPAYTSAKGEEQETREKMQQGDTGQDVFTMQERLRTLGYLSSEAVDGTYGPATAAAVRAFQQANGLDEDGIAGQNTVTAMYAADAIAVGSAAEDALLVETVSNRSRELDEQQAGGAIQASLAGGGVAASHNSVVYYAGKNGNLTKLTSSGSTSEIYTGKAGFIHASDRGITFASGNKILRIDPNGGNPQTLATARSLKKLSVIGDTLFYLDGNTLMKASTGVEPQTLGTGLNDFTIDVEQYLAYMASDDGITSIGLNGNAQERIVSTAADQVQLVGGVVFFRSGGTLYRVQNGISVKIMDANATWMAAYRELIYYVSSNALYRCETDGTNVQLFYDGKIGRVSFVSGQAYIGATDDGPVTEIISVDY